MNTASIGYRNAKTVEEQGGWLQYIAPADLKQFGLIPELIGRFPVLTFLNPLDESALRRILTEPKNALVKQYTKLFDIDGVKLEFDQEVLDFIVQKAMEFGLGARGLRSICEAILTDAMFDLPSSSKKSLSVNLDYATQQFGKSKIATLKVA
jgi:ATP-dependent Clp protease ATP-binding subunit ClpX